jgi:tetratricopeptide (TPR) repeat protein
LSIEWKILNQECTDLYRAGKYDRAVVVAQKALQVAEQNVGPDHPDVATSLNSLAELCRTQGDYAKAEPLYKRSLAIWEKALGPDHPDVAMSLNNLA